MNFLDRKALAQHKGLVDGKVLMLLASVDNPKPDRRVTNDWRKQPQVPAGKRFFIRAEAPLHPTLDATWRLDPVDGRVGVGMHDDLWPVLVAAGSVDDLTSREWLMEALDPISGGDHGPAAFDVLVRMVHSGHVRREAVTTIVAAIAEESDEL